MTTGESVSAAQFDVAFDAAVLTPGTATVAGAQAGDHVADSEVVEVELLHADGERVHAWGALFLLGGDRDFQVVGFLF